MKMKLLISAMMVMFFSLMITNNVSAQMRRGYVRFIRPHRLFVPPVPRVSIAVRPPVPVVAYGCDDYPVYRRPAPAYYGGAYYYGDRYVNRGRGYDRDDYRRYDRRENYRGNERGYDHGYRDGGRRYR